MTRTTTDPPSGSDRGGPDWTARLPVVPPSLPHRTGVSVRTRLTLTVALLTTFAMLTAGVVIYALEGERRDAALVDEANQQVTELRQLARTGVDPSTGAPFAGAVPLLRTFMQRSVPGPHEMLVGWVDGAAVLRSPSSPHPGLTRLDTFTRTVDDLAAGGGSRRIDTSYGEVLVTVQPVVGGQERAALVIASFLSDERASLNTLLGTYTVVSLLSILLITGLAAWQSGRLLSPLRELSDAAREITVSDLSRRVPETGNDDVTQLTRTVNEMLERLDTAFVGQRQLLDDAGHELRTPLTVLRGHLELLDASDPEEVAATRDLLLDEVDRMGRLVDDLLILAKSRRPDFLTTAPVDLDDLTRTVLAKARAMAPRHWQLDEVAPVQVVVDEDRITQALLQLVDNAVKHTDPDDTIALGCGVEAGTARVWVRDTGDGIPPEAAETALERFGRVGVRPGDEGFGLGLSIVAAIAEAHGGKVVITETEGGGATLVVELPREESAWPAS
ncbi:sensor histidine kinase [Nocardioides jishulii]|uniref:histidine kinase n=1 Tax=Nocardioides jishulii TaxID=2575440 RepID=A0A4U2YQ28_9ACTN|nr:HAMP domain-containing sensor histidine kinase [Nocardioides jishulii]QCX27936.1 HAMP domain-containing histidine kinase [Nocardioides jishulii]TKI62742.1 HAMP domain-containing histidine kinase [Nocardioides jishulii]